MSRRLGRAAGLRRVHPGALALHRARPSGLCGGDLPGRPEGVEFCRCRLSGVNGLVFDDDQDTADLAEHVGGGGVGLGGVLGCVLAVVGGGVGVKSGFDLGIKKHPLAEMISLAIGEIVKWAGVCSSGGVKCWAGYWGCRFGRPVWLWCNVHVQATSRHPALVSVDDRGETELVEWLTRMGDRTDRTAELWLGRNESPIGPDPGTVNRIRAPADKLHHYPSGLTEAVTGVAAEELQMSSDQVLIQPWRHLTLTHARHVLLETGVHASLE